MLLTMIEGVSCVLVCVGQWSSAPSMIIPVAYVTLSCRSMRMSTAVAMKLPLKEFILMFLLKCTSMFLCDFDPTIGIKCVV